MGRMKGLAAIFGVAVLIVVVAACGSKESVTGDRQTEIAQALEATEGSEVKVSGHLIVDSDGNARLCSVLLESGPPQCGGDRIDLLEFDASSVPNSKTPQRPSEIQTARWTDSYITVTGIKGVGGLAEVRLSDEPAGDSTDAPVPSAASQGRENISCFPTGLVARVGASVGDSWTLAGNIRLQGKIPGPPNELRDRSAESSVTFTLTGLDDGGMNRVVDEATGKRARIENSVAYAHVKTVYRDDEDNILAGTDRDEDLYNELLAAFGTETIAIIGYDRQVLLTTDWDCHRNTWMTGGIPSSGDITRESSVGEIDLPTRSIVLFIETTAGDEFATKWVYGYGKVTGRLVLTERHQSGTFDGQPYTLDMVREWVPALNLSGINVAPPAPGPAVTGMIAPNLRLTFKGVEYTGVEILGAASPNGPIVCCGTPINTDDMEAVGTGIQHNPDGDAPVPVYRPKADDTTDLYTFNPAQKSSEVEGARPEDDDDTTDVAEEAAADATAGVAADADDDAAGPATWTRWTSK